MTVALLAFKQVCTIKADDCAGQLPYMRETVLQLHISIRPNDRSRSNCNCPDRPVRTACIRIQGLQAFGACSQMPSAVRGDTIADM